MAKICSTQRGKYLLYFARYPKQYLRFTESSERQEGQTTDELGVGKYFAASG